MAVLAAAEHLHAKHAQAGGAVAAVPACCPWPFDAIVGLAARMLYKADISVGFQDGPLDLIE
jgi:hypothetical protein